MEIPKANNLWLPFATLAFAFLLRTISLPGYAAYAALVLHQRIRIYPAIQQAGMILLILAVYLVIKHTLRSFIGLSSGQVFLSVLPAVSSAFVWPFIYLTLRGLRIRYRVK